MKIQKLCQSIIGYLGDKEFNRRYTYDVVFYIRGRYFVIKNVELDYYNYIWNMTVVDPATTEYTQLNNFPSAGKLLDRYRHYKNRFINLLNKDVIIHYIGNGYKYPISLSGLSIKGMRADESNSQLIFYFE